MSPIVLNAAELADGVAWLTSGDEQTLTISDDPIELPPQIRKLWVIVLLMAVRDRATSVHYHPWRSDDVLTYVVDRVRYELIPPPAEYTDVMLAAARSLFISPWRRLFSCLVGFGSTGSVCSSVSLDGLGKSIAWNVVIWSNGEQRGVELFRVTPLEPPKAE